MFVFEYFSYSINMEKRRKQQYQNIAFFQNHIISYIQAFPANLALDLYEPKMIAILSLVI